MVLGCVKSKRNEWTERSTTAALPPVAFVQITRYRLPIQLPRATEGPLKGHANIFRDISTSARNYHGNCKQLSAAVRAIEGEIVGSLRLLWTIWDLGEPQNPPRKKCLKCPCLVPTGVQKRRFPLISGKRRHSFRLCPEEEWTGLQKRRFPPLPGNITEIVRNI